MMNESTDSLRLRVQHREKCATEYLYKVSLQSTSTEHLASGMRILTRILSSKLIEASSNLDVTQKIDTQS